MDVRTSKVDNTYVRAAAPLKQSRRRREPVKAVANPKYPERHQGTRERQRRLRQKATVSA